jgi:hypothetical protein
LTKGVLLCGRPCQALFLVFPTSGAHSPCGRPNGSVVPSLCWWLPDPWSSLAPNALLSVVTSLGQTPDPAGALGAWEARGGPPLLRIGARSAPGPRSALSTPAHNRARSSEPLYALAWASRTPPPCAPLLRGALPSSGSARGRSVTAAPAPPARFSGGGPCPGHTAPAPTACACSAADSTPSPRPSLWPGSASSPSRPASARVPERPGPSGRASACGQRTPPPAAAAARPATQNLPSQSATHSCPQSRGAWPPGGPAPLPALHWGATPRAARPPGARSAP